MKIAMIGSGAMGANFGMLLHLAGNDVHFIDAYEPHVEAMKKDGLYTTIEGKALHALIPVYYPEESQHVLGDADLVILFTKANQLDEMLARTAPYFGKETAVLCLLNGMGHDEVVLKYVDNENFYLGNTMWSAGFVEPGRVKFNPDGSVSLKEMGSAKQKKVALKIVEVLSKAKLNASYAESMMYSIYKKLCANATMNGLCTILDGNMTSVGKAPTGSEMIAHIVDEIVAVANHEGIPLKRDEMIANIEFALDPNGIGVHYPSMYQDLINAHRLTEVDCINGIVAKKGAQYGISTPYNKFLTELIHAKEVLLGAK